MLVIAAALMVPNADLPYAPKYSPTPPPREVQCPYPVTGRDGSVLYYSSRAGCVGVPEDGPTSRPEQKPRCKVPY